jgi:23S rRNA (guanosine2251-2'-O)-methyltransferase
VQRRSLIKPYENSSLDGTTARYGIHPVLEALSAGVVLEVIATGLDRPQVAAVVRRAMYLRIAVREALPGDLDRLTGGARHQGVAAMIRPHRYLTYDDLRVRVAAASEMPLLIALDGVEDPQNFGAVLRTADGAGALAVVVGTRNSVPVTAAVARASAGAVDRVPVARVESLPTALVALKLDGFTIVGLDGEALSDYDRADLRGRVVVVAGSEGRGIGRAVRHACDMLVRIPLHGSLASLNLAVAVAVVAFAVRAQRRERDNPVGPSVTAQGADGSALPVPVEPFVKRGTRFSGSR